MESLYRTSMSTEFGPKAIEVYCCDVTLFDEDIDIFTTSAFEHSYYPSPGTAFKALNNVGISVKRLARRPFLDLRASCHTWLSEGITSHPFIHRIGCVELCNRKTSQYIDNDTEQSMINSIRAYFRMLDIAAIYGVKMGTVALPLLGTGNQNISSSLMIIPLLNECISFLKRNSEVKRICFIERSTEKANLIKNSIRDSLSISALSAETVPCVPTKPKAMAFISHSSLDKNIADNLCFQLEQRGVAVWYAPRDVHGPYASEIVNAIEKCTHFVIILSQNSMSSQHVLNEVDLATKRLPNNIKFKPLRVDNSFFTASFKYYLSTQHWMDATNPPLDNRLREFVDELLEDLH